MRGHSPYCRLLDAPAPWKERWAAPSSHVLGIPSSAQVKGATPPIATPPRAGRGLSRHAHCWLGRVEVCVDGPPSLPLVLGGGDHRASQRHTSPLTLLDGTTLDLAPDSVRAARVPQDGYWWGCGEPLCTRISE